MIYKSYFICLVNNNFCLISSDSSLHPSLTLKMGADGGSIPRRIEMVKTKAKTGTLYDSEILKTQWTCCYISKKPLEKPIVACGLGRLYNKDSVVLYLMNKNETEASLASELAHIKSLKSLINCNLTCSKTPTESPYFICPVSGREMNGKSKFFVTRTCGCVLSEQAINQFPDSKTCLVCERKDFDSQKDLIPLYPKGEELAKLRANLSANAANLSATRAANHAASCADNLVKSTSAVAKKRPVVTSVSSANLLLEEIKSCTPEITTLKRSKVTETLYFNKKNNV